ncbi:hypothetical protein ENSA7_14230 [Enhygromyxa salina]|uniref:Uncharacterized protein n=1 Tax=Enhygromyxa salina TaxID=215803 RepID=A0A2S9YUK4_9BACT|nr:hypothetical protein ENSA7_14230 [Enhygromyxa salina]
MSSPIVWFHAFRRNSVGAAINALRNGFAPAPPAAAAPDTGQLELELRISPARVYCYLGRTLETFGEWSIAFHNPDFKVFGEVSPFDTGGLVRKISPVCTWERERRQTFLHSYTWSESQRQELLQEHPGLDFLSDYLDLTRAWSPPHSGPHEVWNDKPAAAIWRGNPDWRSWTWEGRFDTFKAERVVAWSSPPSFYAQLLDWHDSEADDDEAEWFRTFFQKYISGGTGALVRELVGRQLAQCQPK